MDFFQIIDVCADAPSIFFAIVEVALATIFSIALGLAVQFLPSLLLVRSSARPSVQRHKGSTHKSAEPRKAPASLPTASKPKPLVSTQDHEQKSTDDLCAAPHNSHHIADRTLDAVLDDFFENETLLDDALLETVAQRSVSPPGAPAHEAPPSDSAKDFDAELAKRMGRGFISKGGHIPKKQPPRVTKPSTPQIDDVLENVLSAYMDEEELLDAALLDTALQSANVAEKP